MSASVTPLISEGRSPPSHVHRLCPCRALSAHPSPEPTQPWGHLTGWPEPNSGIGGHEWPRKRKEKTMQRTEIESEVASEAERGRGRPPIPGRRAKEVTASSLQVPRNHCGSPSDPLSCPVQPRASHESRPTSHRSMRPGKSLPSSWRNSNHVPCGKGLARQMPMKTGCSQLSTQVCRGWWGRLGAPMGPHPALGPGESRAVAPYALQGDQLGRREAWNAPSTQCSENPSILSVLNCLPFQTRDSPGLREEHAEGHAPAAVV